MSSPNAPAADPQPGRRARTIMRKTVNRTPTARGRKPRAQGTRASSRLERRHFTLYRRLSSLPSGAFSMISQSGSPLWGTPTSILPLPPLPPSGGKAGMGGGYVTPNRIRPRAPGVPVLGPTGLTTFSDSIRYLQWLSSHSVPPPVALGNRREYRPREPWLGLRYNPVQVVREVNAMLERWEYGRAGVPRRVP